MKICLVLEGSYPYVNGGVSTWMHNYIKGFPQHEFVLWVIGAKARDRGKFVYEMLPNVSSVHEVFLDDALRPQIYPGMEGALHRGRNKTVAGADGLRPPGLGHPL